MPRPNYWNRAKIKYDAVKGAAEVKKKAKEEIRTQKKRKKNAASEDIKNDAKKIIEANKKIIKNLNKEERKLLNLIIKTAKSKNWVTDSKLRKAGIPEELFDSIRIMSEKIHGNRIVFIQKPLKKISVVVKGSIIIISGVTAMQIPRLITEYRKNKQLLDRHHVKYNLTEFLRKDLKQYKVAIEVPSNVFSKRSWGNYLKTNGVSFAGGALVATATIAVLTAVIKRKYNQIRAKAILRKKGILKK